MNAVLGFVQLMEFDPNNPILGPQKDRVQQILKSGEYLLELIDQVLELSKIESGKILVSMEDIPVNIVIENCLTQVRLRAQEEKIKIFNDSIKMDLPKVWADSIRLKKALLELLSNSITYNHNGGKVTIACEDTADKMLRIKVMDTGRGIAKDKQGNLFQAFKRLGLQAGQIEGTGIGL